MTKSVPRFGGAGLVETRSILAFSSSAIWS
jgi:hypothetical protein